jgi:16S rRNA processing protein RimM
MIREETISLGSITKIHALKGELLLTTELNLEEYQINTEWVFFDYQGQLIPFFIENLDITGAFNILLKVEEINSIDQAKEWIGKRVFIPADALTKVKRKKQGIHKLQGFLVKDEKIGLIGTIDAIIEYQNNPLIRIIYNQKEILIPFSDSIIKKIDHKKRILYILTPDGLIDLYLAQ